MFIHILLGLGQLFEYWRQAFQHFGHLDFAVRPLTLYFSFHLLLVIVNKEEPSVLGLLWADFLLSSLDFETSQQCGQQVDGIDRDVIR